MPKAHISILTPTNKATSFLPHAAASVDAAAAVAGCGVEHLVVDGSGSPSSPLDGISRGRSGVCRVLRLPGSPSSGAALNYGLTRAAGEVIGWLSDDDMYPATALAAVAQLFARRPDVDLVYGHAHCVDEDGRVYRTLRCRRFRRRRLWRKPAFQLPSVFFRRSALEGAGPLDENLQYHAALDLWLRMASSGARFCRLPEALGAKRIHNANRLTGVFRPEHLRAACREALDVVHRRQKMA